MKKGKMVMRNFEHRKNGYRLSILLIVVSLSLVPAWASANALSSAFLYNLSNFTGAVPYSWVKVSIDKERNEVYVANLSDNSVRIFNENGMEVYSFNDDGSLGSIFDIAVDKDGHILLLSYMDKKYSIFLCDFRGEPISKIELKNLPRDFSEFSPSEMAYKEGHIYLADKQNLKVLVTDEKGVFEKSYDLFAILKLEEKKRGSVDARGFSVDKDGNILFTVPVLFQAFKLSPDGKLSAFGQRGSSPGKFNIAAGIISDDKGNLYVSDTLKCAVLVFDKDFRFIKQFGDRGYAPGDLIAPMGLAINNDRLYVSQSARRGVSVFRIIDD